MKDLIDLSAKETEKLRDISASMQSYARAFSITGNSEFSQILYDIAEEIYNIQGNISKAVGQTVHNEYQKVMKDTGEILSMVLEKSLKEY